MRLAPDSATSLRPPPPPRLALPSDAYDYEYFRDRLVDPSVLIDSVAVRIFRAPFLAVPVGGPRRGGSIPVDFLPSALAVSHLLVGRPGFAAPRVRWSPYYVGHLVEWGERPPQGDIAARGRFYGYNDRAIAEFLRRRPPPTSSSTSTFRPPTASQRP